MNWIEIDGGASVMLDGTKVLYRNPKGRQLVSLPKAVKDHPEVIRLKQLSEWLTRHEAESKAQVETWMIRSLPIASALVSSVWADKWWRSALTDLVIAECPNVLDGTGDFTTAGFLRSVTDNQIKIIDLDGETQTISTDAIVIPHPILLTDVIELNELREFSLELDITQCVDQLFRQTFEIPKDRDGTAVSVSDYAGGKFQQLRHTMGTAKTLGYQVKNGSASVPILEHGRTLTCSYQLGDGDPSYETITGDLTWEEKGRRAPLAEVGPIAWSEGNRMAGAIFARRSVEEEQE